MMALAACSADSVVDMSEPTTASENGTPERVAVVLNRADMSLSLIPFADTLRTRTLPLFPPASARMPVDIDVRGERAVVAAGDAVGLVDLRAGVVTWVGGLAPSPASGVAFVSDTAAVLVFPGAGRAVAVHPVRGTVRAVPGVGPAPAVVRAVGGRVYVAGDSAGAGMVAVLDPALRRIGTVSLGGTEPRAVALRGTVLAVLNAGRAGQAEGSVSLVDTVTLRELTRYTGFGEQPASLAINSAGLLFVGVPGVGVTAFDPPTRAFTRVAAAPAGPAGATNGAEAWRVAADPAGAVYLLSAGACERPGALVRVDVSGLTPAAASTGTCPVDVDFTLLPRR
jgi:DNA-binding beta-propeller fold protein YncE